MLFASLLYVLVACAPAYRMPGPLHGLGSRPAPGGGASPTSAPGRPAASAPAASAPAASVPAAARPDPWAGVALRSAEPPPVDDGRGAAIARAAAGFLGARSLRAAGSSFRYDCSGFVSAAMAAAGRPLSGSSASMFEEARALGVLHRRLTPSVGDVAFFDDTYDRNRNGKLDDPLSHVAIVTTVEGNGTIGMVHLGGQGVTRLRMNLREPHVGRAPDGSVYNDLLRRRSSSDRSGTRYLAGELWVGFGSFWSAETSVASESTR
jgi:cell wall-associated NlpC family hydrolase